MGGCNLFPDNGLVWRRIAPPHSREFFPDIGLLARRNFAHTIQNLLLIIASTIRNIIRLSKCE